MHEASLAQALIDQALAIGTEHPGQAVVGLRVTVGAWSAVVPDSLTFFFNEMAADTPLAGARLDIVTAARTAHCRTCGFSGSLPDIDFACPACGGPDLDLLSGHELELTAMELEDPHGNPRP